MIPRPRVFLPLAAELDECFRSAEDGSGISTEAFNHSVDVVNDRKPLGRGRISAHARQPLPNSPTTSQSQVNHRSRTGIRAKAELDDHGRIVDPQRFAKISRVPPRIGPDKGGHAERPVGILFRLSALRFSLRAETSPFAAPNLARRAICSRSTARSKCQIPLGGVVDPAPGCWARAKAAFDFWQRRSPETTSPPDHS